MTLELVIGVGVDTAFGNGLLPPKRDQTSFNAALFPSWNREEPPEQLRRPWEKEPSWCAGALQMALLGRQAGARVGDSGARPRRPQTQTGWGAACLPPLSPGLA